MLRPCQQRCQGKPGVGKGQSQGRNTSLRISFSQDLRHSRRTGSGASPSASLTCSLAPRAEGLLAQGRTCECGGCERGSWWPALRKPSRCSLADPVHRISPSPVIKPHCYFNGIPGRAGRITS